MLMLKPLPLPKPRPFRIKRLPRGKRVTIAAGFSVFDGIVLCADTQETIPGYVKSNKGKIRVWQDEGLNIAIVGSGDSESIETLSQLVEGDLVGDYSPTEIRFPDDYRQKVEKVLLEFFERSIVPYAAFPKEDRPSVDLMIAIMVLNKVNNYQCLFRATGTTVREIKGDADCMGTGVTIAKGLIERFYSPFRELDELVIVACYIMLHTKKSADMVGGNTDLVVASFTNKFFGALSSQDVKSLESIFEQFDECMADLLIGFANRNVTQDVFKTLTERVFERMTQERIIASAMGKRLFDVFDRLKTKPYSEPPVSDSSQSQKP